VGKFDLFVFCSWSSEHLVYKLLTEHYRAVGSRLIDSLEEGLDTGSPLSAFRHALSRVFERLSALPGGRPA
jgi:hypothetical protein